MVVSHFSARFSLATRLTFYQPATIGAFFAFVMGS